jgi:hypothetical protein
MLAVSDVRTIGRIGDMKVVGYERKRKDEVWTVTAFR